MTDNSMVVDFGLWRLGAAYLLLLIPLAILLYQRVPILKDCGIAVLRMTVQLLFVGFYLQVVFRLNNPWLNFLWLAVMICVADFSILRGCRVNTRRFLLPVFTALLAGTVIPLGIFMGPLLQRPNLLDAQYAIPISGMILGNCLRANIIGLQTFYETVTKNEKPFFHKLAQGALLNEALRPYLRDALQSALMPTVASMATIGLVALPGMMTGIILAGGNPMTAIRYQIAIMIAIFAGTAVTTWLAIHMTIPKNFSSYGMPDSNIFKKHSGHKG